MKNCNICKKEPALYFNAEILNKYHINYLYCNECHFIFTEEPYWLDEAYSDAIVNSDVGLLERNNYLSQKIFRLVHYIFGREVKGIDIAGGYGVFTRLMRDLGQNFYWNDPYAKNIFAKGYEGDILKEKYDIVTAFEVLEHTEDPVKFISESLQISKENTIILSTETFKKLPSKQWWYFSFKNGQHISFFSKVSLLKIADKLEVNYFGSKNIHIFTTKKLSPIIIRLLLHRITNFLNYFIKKKYTSKIESDHSMIMK